MVKEIVHWTYLGMKNARATETPVSRLRIPRLRNYLKL